MRISTVPFGRRRRIRMMQNHRTAPPSALVSAPPDAGRSSWAHFLAAATASSKHGASAPSSRIAAGLVRSSSSIAAAAVSPPSATSTACSISSPSTSAARQSAASGLPAAAAAFTAALASALALPLFPPVLDGGGLAPEPELSRSKSGSSACACTAAARLAGCLEMSLASAAAACSRAAGEPKLIRVSRGSRAPVAAMASCIGREPAARLVSMAAVSSCERRQGEVSTQGEGVGGWKRAAVECECERGDGVRGIGLRGPASHLHNGRSRREKADDEGNGARCRHGLPCLWRVAGHVGQCARRLAHAPPERRTQVGHAAGGTHCLAVWRVQAEQRERRGRARSDASGRAGLGSETRPVASRGIGRRVLVGCALLEEGKEGLDGGGSADCGLVVGVAVCEIGEGAGRVLLGARGACEGTGVCRLAKALAACSLAQGVPAKEQGGGQAAAAGATACVRRQARSRQN
eukprot:scaffold20962_cov112-Isochrysis_galbana.AAC.4